MDVRQANGTNVHYTTLKGQGTPRNQNMYPLITLCKMGPSTEIMVKRGNPEVDVFYYFI